MLVKLQLDELDANVGGTRQIIQITDRLIEHESETRLPTKALHRIPLLDDKGLFNVFD
ncbi:MAG: hypothetical protein AAB266_06565 [Nitrospirota bacterium]